ncbi:EamA family transporter [Corynebacterium minutissimum]|uniref:EamA family transporter n=1 Tax=Corynebacterium minutissimum TaxID=38301 RepID=UPI001EF3838E|nr:EamA family transporter [Corynebacterium minutissimum]
MEPLKVDFGCAVWRVIGVDEWLLLRVVPLGPAVTIEFVGPLLLAAVLSRSLRDATCVTLALIGMALLGVDSLTGEPLNPRGALVLVSDPWLLFVALGTGVLASLIPYSLEFIALKRLAPNVFSILIALEPVFAAFFGWLLLSPGVTALKLTAIALVVLASVVQTMVPARGHIIFRTIALRPRRPRAPWRFRRPQN